MIKSEVNLLNSDYSHLYIEKDILEHNKTKKIINYFSKSKIVIIDHYKDIFSRNKQSFSMQKKSKKIILAKKRDNYLYNGSEMCDNFGYNNFYYTNDIMNCIYDCEYCYLQGMYPSSNIVIFVNIEDTINALKHLSIEDNIFVCISYDSDILALENVTGFAKDWYDAVKGNNKLILELRTKSANSNFFKNVSPIDNFILAWTLSPEYIISNFEKNTPSLKNRINTIKKALENKWNVRICFDPLLYISDYKKHYKEMIDIVFKEININDVYDISIGTFRIGKDLYKNMKQKNKKSYILAYPFVEKNGHLCYNDNHNFELINFVTNKINSIKEQ